MAADPDFAAAKLKMRVCARLSVESGKSEQLEVLRCAKSLVKLGARRGRASHRHP